MAVVEDVDLDPGEWLATHRMEMDRGESSWLEALGDFDFHQLWALDGQFSCMQWLMWKTHMARATAYEKVRIARALRCRPLIKDAFDAGRVSYSAIRIISRLRDPDPGVDEAMVNLAESGKIVDLERVVRAYEMYANQDRQPKDLRRRRNLRINDLGDGVTKIEILLETTEAAEVAAAIDALIDRSADDKSPAGDNQDADWSGEQSPVGDSGEALMDSSPWPGRRADAFLDLVRTGRAHAGEGHAGGADRYLVHLVERSGRMELLDGTPIEPSVAARIACDRSTVRHEVDDRCAPLAVGRKTRDWSTAQRRAIAVRDGGRCRFPGCEHRYVDVHHIVAWEDGGPTDVSNGIEICSPHHTMLHQGYYAVGDGNTEVRFFRSDRSFLASTTPLQRAQFV